MKEGRKGGREEGRREIKRKRERKGEGKDLSYRKMPTNKYRRNDGFKSINDDKISD